MGMVSELTVTVGVEGTQAVIDALAKIDGAQVKLKDNTATSTKGMKMSWSDFTTGLNQGLQLAKTALDGVKIAMDMVNDYSTYNLAMKQGSIATGMMVDEYSRLVQAADDAYVTQDKFTTSMEMATKNGYPITIDSLGIIADKLNGITNPSEKAKLAMDIFGRGWADIMPFLDRGSVGINALTGNINSNMIATDASVAKTKRFATAVDDFNDAATGAKNELGSAVMPELTKMLNDFTSYADLKSKVNDLVKAGTIDQKEYNKALWASKPGEALLGLYNANIQEYTQSLSKATTTGNDLWQTLFDSSGSWATFSDGAKRAGLDLGMITEEFYNSEKAAAAMSQGVDDVSVDIAKSAEELAQLAKVQSDIVNATGLTAWFGSIVSYAKNYTEIQKQINDKQAEYDKMPGWKKTSADAKQLLTDIETLKQGYTDLANQMTLDMFQATIAIGGVTDAEMGAYLDMAVEMGVISQEGADAATDAYNDAIGKINAMGIDEKTGNVVVDAAAAFAAFDLIEAYAFADKTVRVMMQIGASPSSGPWDQAIGGPVYPGNAYNWQEPGREGELLIPSQYGRVASSTEVAQMLRGAMRPGDGANAGNQAQVVNNNHTEVNVQATISNDYDVDKLTREIVRRINA